MANLTGPVNLLPGAGPVRQRWLIVLIVVLALAAAVRIGAGVVLNTNVPWVVQQGSGMEPAIAKGDLALVQRLSPAGLHSGEIVAIAVPPSYRALHNEPPVILRRIVRVYETAGGLSLVTRGDHNRYPDPRPFAAGDVRGRVVGVIPLLGWVPLVVDQHIGLTVIVGLLVLALLYRFSTTGFRGVRVLRARARAASPASGMDLSDLTAAINVYGQHLASHTESVQAMAASARALQEVVERQTRILLRLDEWFEQRNGLLAGSSDREAPPRSLAAPSPPPAPESEPSLTVPPAAPPPLRAGGDPAGVLPEPALTWSLGAVNDMKHLSARDAARIVALLERRGRIPVLALDAASVVEGPGFAVWLRATRDGWEVSRVVSDRSPELDDLRP